MKLKYGVTFEFDERPPQTHNGVVEGTSPSACARRAVLAATIALKPRNWSSFVFVALERLPDEDSVESPKSEVQPTA